MRRTLNFVTRWRARVDARTDCRPSLAQRSANEAGEGSRTPDLLFTRQVLYQLSYSGSEARLDGAGADAQVVVSVIQARAR
jgi:hypothetical protein